MSSISRAPTYNLKVVLQMTGIKPDTLRAWERRYGLPKPQRTSGGHRLYSQYDIEMIRWLLNRQSEGMRINRAVDLWRSLEAEGRDPLDGAEQFQVGEVKGFGAVIAGGALDEARRAWVSSCLAYDEANAERILAQSFALYPLEAVCLEVLQRGLREIGDLWYEGQATVQQEHFASALALRKLESLIAVSPPPTRLERIIVGCPPEEEHIFSPLLITLFLRHRGWDVVYLGANVPRMHLERVVRDTRARLIVMTATQLKTAANLREMADHLRTERIPLAFGGPIFNRIPELRSRIPGHFLGERLDRVIPAIERVISYPSRIPEIGAPHSHYRQAYEDFRRHVQYIQARVRESLPENGMAHPILEIANEYLCQNISAALLFGDLDFLRYELDWVEVLIRNHDMPVELLGKYLNVFAEAIEQQMPVSGKMVADWLRSVKGV